MNICMVTLETIFHKYGGVETYVHQLAKRFANKGHRVFVLSISSKNLQDNFEADGINYIMVPTKNIKIPKLPLYPIKMLLFNIQAAIAIRKLNQKYKLDIVHAQFCCGFFYAISKIFTPDNAKFMVTLHGTLVDEQLAHIRPIWRNLHHSKIAALYKSLKTSASFFPLIIMEYISVKRAAGIIASSYDTLRNAIKYYKIDPKKATVIYSGINPENLIPEEHQNKKQYTPYSDTFNVLYVGRADERKGISLLLDAAPIVISQNPNVRFFLVGPDTEKYYAQLEKTGLERFFVLAGKVPPATLQQYYQISDIFVLPSLYEGFGLVVLEAFAAGKPVIAFNVASLPELIDNGKNGVLVTAIDPKALALSIEMLTKNPSLLKMRFNARETAKRFTWESTCYKTLSFYNKVAYVKNVTQSD
ncbi:glycosyltransferase family 4 protein [Candidatus Bathyarchaeota archaeon A05DMB-2]|jgi:glycosyltransferase involved in cell wall biosynthesis|nr:glycosyltransferase family 4 protein [Candidatus Bathyarchaeota archaeon A05DMB-2]